MLSLVAGILLAAAAGALPAQTPAGAPAGEAAPGSELLPAGALIAKSGVRIRAPKNWRRLKYVETDAHLIHLAGDGLGLPPVDERGGPLQVGMAVERFPDQSAADLAAELVGGAEHGSERRLLGRAEREEVELAGGLRGTMLYFTFDKGGGRKSFYQQLVVPDPQKGAWLVTGWIVASVDSALPARGSDLAGRLATYVRSIELAPTAGQ